ncbi:MAG TPA: hypothetical protein VNW68_08450, partial [Candidatus Limnocylindria bacterium]|nr:hypothetical protein [Candidatus Limnocylindria bacterium]
WTVIAFTNNLGAINEATARADIVRAEAAGLEQRLARGQRELELVQTDPFLRMQARGYGMGLPGEQVFVLPNDTPPALTAPLTGSLPASGAGSPLEAWLDLLFGD